jgi:CRISPR-associated protein Cas1
MYELRFGEEPPARRSIEQLRGIEGARVREMYKQLARKFGVSWEGRQYDAEVWESGDLANRCLSAATACLYGISEAAILAAGYAPAIGFIHTGKPQSFVYDVADLVKFETVVPLAFEQAAKVPLSPERAVRVACRDVFRKTRILERLIPLIEEVLAAGGIDKPGPGADQLAPAIPLVPGVGDAGHRR